LPQDDRPSRLLAAQEPSEDALTRFEVNAAGIEVRTMSFVSQRPARDLCDLADAKEAGVIVLESHGAPRAALTRGVVREVIDAATCPVAVLVGPAFESSPRRVLVLGSKRLRVADSLARGLDVEVANLDAADVSTVSAADVLVVDTEESDALPQCAATLLLVHSPPLRASQPLAVARARGGA